MKSGRRSATPEAPLDDRRLLTGSGPSSALTRRGGRVLVALAGLLFCVTGWVPWTHYGAEVGPDWVQSVSRWVLLPLGWRVLLTVIGLALLLLVAADVRRRFVIVGVITLAWLGGAGVWYGVTTNEPGPEGAGEPVHYAHPGIHWGLLAIGVALLLATAGAATMLRTRRWDDEPPG